MASADAGDAMEPGQAVTGTLYGIGLGPGDPELVTLKAARLIATCPVIAYPALPGVDSFARSIAAQLIPDGAEEIVIEVPIAVARAPAQAAYDTGAERIAEVLETGRDVACLCEGDPFFYGSFMYLHARLADRFRVQVVPGVSSVTAAAACAGLPLAARNDCLSVVPAPLPEEILQARIEAADSVAIMKLGRHMPKVRAVLDRLGLTSRAVYVERATLDAQKVFPLAEAPENAPYFSMILVTKGDDPWL